MAAGVETLLDRLPRPWAERPPFGCPDAPVALGAAGAGEDKDEHEDGDMVAGDEGATKKVRVCMMRKKEGSQVGSKGLVFIPIWESWPGSCNSP